VGLGAGVVGPLAGARERPGRVGRLSRCSRAHVFCRVRGPARALVLCRASAYASHRRGGFPSGSGPVAFNRMNFRVGGYFSAPSAANLTAVSAEGAGIGLER
jgi:hypothetical protein